MKTQKAPVRTLFLVLLLVKRTDGRSTAGLVCGPEHGNTRLLFLHIFKASGSTIRDKLRQYALSCDKRWACLVSCNKTNILDDKYVHCALKDVVNSVDYPSSSHHDLYRHNRKQINLKRDHIVHYEIIGGHISTYLSPLYTTKYNLKWITILREPVASFISGIKYSHHHLSLSSMLTMLNTVEHGNYANALHYIYPGEITHQAYQQASALLLHTFALVGIVENYETTLRMLNDFIDPSHHYKGWLRSSKLNPSHGPSFSDILLAAGPRIARNLISYCKLETSLYRSALEAHAATCRAILFDKPPSPLSSTRCDCRLELRPLQTSFSSSRHLLSRNSSSRSSDGKNHTFTSLLNTSSHQDDLIMVQTTVCGA